MDVETYEDPWDPVDLPEQIQDETQPEHLNIALPSALLMGSAYRVPLAQFLQQQFELRKGHTNDSLALICTIIGQEAFQYKKYCNLLRNQKRHSSQSGNC